LARNPNFISKKKLIPISGDFTVRARPAPANKPRLHNPDHGIDHSSLQGSRKGGESG
jgi:hypothetical protein